jgi:hypothetical protein
VSKNETGTALEAHPETEFCLQGRGLAATELEARLLRVTVSHLRQLFEALPRDCSVPRQADVKVGLEGPLPKASVSRSRETMGTLL